MPSVGARLAQDLERARERLETLVAPPQRRAGPRAETRRARRSIRCRWCRGCWRGTRGWMCGASRGLHALPCRRDRRCARAPAARRRTGTGARSAARSRPQRGIRNAPHVREHAGGAHFLGEVLQVAVEHRQRRRAVGERALGLVRARIPRAQPEPGEVEHIQHLRHVALPHQRRVGLVEQVVEQHGFAEVKQRAAHAYTLPHS